MKAAVYDRYGPLDVLHIEDIQEPAPRDDEVLVQVHSSSINYANPALVRGNPFIIRLMIGGLVRPKYRISGGDIAGHVVSAGQGVKQLQPGNEVFGDLSSDGFRGFAEYVAMPERILSSKPTNTSLREASAIPQAGIGCSSGFA